MNRTRKTSHCIHRRKIKLEDAGTGETIMSKFKAHWAVSVKTGLIAMALAPLFALAPFILGAFMSAIFCGPDANEGNCAWAALPWFMFITIPVGALMFLAGLVILIVSLAKKLG